MTTIELPAANVFTEGDRALADMIGLSQPHLEELTHTQVHYLGNITILGTNEEVPVMRFHTGPDDAIKRGGTKFKFYSEEELQVRDGIDHSRSMFFKIGVIGGPQVAAPDVAPRGHAGGKTVAGVDHHRNSTEQNIDAMRQTARLTHEAGLTNPDIDGTAGDEGTNGLIGHYVDELERLGHPHPWAAITGKADMRTRPSATGRGAAISHRARMEYLDEARAISAVQGAGAAGAHYAAEAYDPLDTEDRQREIVVPALGDIRIEGGRKVPITLHTDHPEGLPITRAMAEAVLAPGAAENDRDMQAVGGNRVYALARKIEQTGVEVRVSDKDVLTYDRGADYLVPAATSNVFTPGNIGSVRIKQILEVGNHTLHDDVRPFIGPLGFIVVPGEVVNAGGVDISIKENTRDLRRIKAGATGGLYLPVSDKEYSAGLKTTMTAATRQVHGMAEKLGTDLQTAANAVGLANYALSRDMEIDASVRDMMLAAA